MSVDKRDRSNETNDLLFLSAKIGHYVFHVDIFPIKLKSPREERSFNSLLERKGLKCKYC